MCKEDNCGESIEVDEQDVKAAVTKSYYPIHVLVGPLPVSFSVASGLANTALILLT